MVNDVKNKKLLYHLTSMDNLESILQKGLLPRASLFEGNFIDVADVGIIDSRKILSLDKFIPFHFFSKTPFDYAVQHNNPDTIFVLIAVIRELAISNSWSIIPKHPLSGEFQIYPYEIGFDLIDWDLLESNKYNYQNNSDYKSTCMAECLSPHVVSTDIFFCLYVKEDTHKEIVTNMLKNFNLNIRINVFPNMFVK